MTLISMFSQQNQMVSNYSMITILLLGGYRSTEHNPFNNVSKSWKATMPQALNNVNFANSYQGNYR